MTVHLFAFVFTVYVAVAVPIMAVCVVIFAFSSRMTIMQPPEIPPWQPSATLLGVHEMDDEKVAALIDAARWLKELVDVTLPEMDMTRRKSTAVLNGYQAVVDLQRVHRIDLSRRATD